MSRAKRKFFREAAAAAETERNQRTDAARADLPWYMQRSWRAVLERALRRYSPQRP
jgi:hypothetical protein